MKRARIGVIGAGWIVKQVHLPILLGFADVEEIRVWDPNPVAIANELEHEGRLQVVGKCEHLFAGQKLDLILIAGPNATHAEYVRRALGAGLNVLCEKPLCIEASDAPTLTQAVRKSAGFLEVSYPNRHRPEVRAVAQLLLDGGLGALYRVRACWSRNRGIPVPAWLFDRDQSGGGVLQDIGSHVIDALLWLTGYPQPESYVGFSSSHFISHPGHRAAWQELPKVLVHEAVEDNITAHIGFREMAWTVELGWTSHRLHDSTVLEFYGTEGYACVETLFGLSPNTVKKSATLTVCRDGSEDIAVFDIADRHAPFRTMLRKVVDRALGLPSTSADTIENHLATPKLIAALYANTASTLRPRSESSPRNGHTPMREREG
jgi:oxidoreductase